MRVAAALTAFFSRASSERLARPSGSGLSRVPAIRRRAAAFSFVPALALLLGLFAAPPAALAQTTPTVVKLVGNTGQAW